jgi:hypothetical protein
MNNSSQQANCSITSSSIDTIDLSCLDTITITDTGSSYTGDTIVLDLSASGANNTFIGYSATTVTSGISNVAIGQLTSSDISFTWKSPEEFIDAFPDWERVEKMCQEYPGLKIALEKFKTTYNLVKDDYDTPKDKRIKP